MNFFFLHVQYIDNMLMRLHADMHAGGVRDYFWRTAAFPTEMKVLSFEGTSSQAEQVWDKTGLGGAFLKQIFKRILIVISPTEQVAPCVAV